MINTCTGFSGAVAASLSKLDTTVDMVISGHTHNAYNCMLPNSAAVPIPVSSAVVVRPARDRHRHDDQHDERPADAISVDNQIVFRDDHGRQRGALVTYYQTAVAPIANAVLGSITADITRQQGRLQQFRR